MTRNSEKLKHRFDAETSNDSILEFEKEET